MNFQEPLMDYNLFQPNFHTDTIVKESRSTEEAIIHSETSYDWANMVNEQIYVKNPAHISCLPFPMHIVKKLEFEIKMRAYEDWTLILTAHSFAPLHHDPVTCSRIHEVDDNKTERRGSSADTINFNAVLDCLYVCRRHAAPRREIAELRQSLLESTGLSLPTEMV